MNIKKQIEAAVELLKKQECTEEEINYFQAFALGLAQKVVAGFAMNFTKLRDLARKDFDPNEDDRATRDFSIDVTMDITDLSVCDIETDLHFAERTVHKTRSASKVSVEDVLAKDDDAQLDLFNGAAAAEPEQGPEDNPPENLELPSDPSETPEPEAKEEEPAPSAAQ